MPISNINHFKQVDTIVNNTLSLFDRYEIHATWATVGLLHYTSIIDLKEKNAELHVPYKNPLFSPFPLSSEKYADFDPSLLLANETIKHILKARNQELASHTFSHFYCCENGIRSADFKEDCQRMNTIGKTLNHQYSSIVFPRNQISSDALAIAHSFGIHTFRGNQENKYWSNSSYHDESFLKKVGRVADAYLNISKTTSYNIHKLPRNEGLLNVPANRFFRPATTYKMLEKSKIKRIKKEMRRAAKNDEVYHLWWHPHNFSKNTTEAFNQLEELLSYYKILQQKFNFSSLTMSEISANVKS